MEECSHHTKSEHPELNEAETENLKNPRRQQHRYKANASLQYNQVSQATQDGLQDRGVVLLNPSVGGMALDIPEEVDVFFS